jgi:hypothetical protein
VLYSTAGAALLLLASCGMSRVDVLETAQFTPDMVIMQGGLRLENGSGLHDFGTRPLYTINSTSFELRNSGDLQLLIDKMYIEEESSTEFLMNGAASPAVPPGGSTTFDIGFKPRTTTFSSVHLVIVTNDPNDAVYRIQLAGTGTTAVAGPPEIEIRRGAQIISSGVSLYSFGSVQEGSSDTAVFTIENSGTAELDVSSIQITGSDFVPNPVSLLVSAGGTETFEIAFTPSAAGPAVETVNILSDDPDESPYTFTVQGEGQAAPQPDIDVSKSGEPVARTTTAHDFGQLTTGSTIEVTFTVENQGTASLDIFDLTLSGSPDFVIQESLSTSILPASSDTFTLRFNPSSLGETSTTVTIDSSDPDENPFQFQVTDEGIPSSGAPDMNVWRDPTEYVNHSSYDFGEVEVGVSVTRTFEIKNPGTGMLEVSSAMMVGPAAGEYDHDVTPFSLSPGETRTFDITFTPSVDRNRNAKIMIFSNEQGADGVYQINLRGKGED